MIAALAPVTPTPVAFLPLSQVAALSWESKLDATIGAANQDVWMKKLSARPHHVGSEYGRQNAEFIRSLYASWGYQARIEEFQVLFPSPRTRVLELVGKPAFSAKLQEPELKEDSTSKPDPDALPTYNAYSVDGDVTGKLVYVDYGTKESYETLEKYGVSVEGKIVISRYGGCWRGLKPKLAAEHGAVGCIIYSDPRDDGYFQGDSYPVGAYRNRQGAQRGSVMDMPIQPGDPLTPGYGATKDAPRLARRDVKVFTKIPVLPISYADAMPLLKELEGPVSPEAWRGALPITYHMGPSKRDVHLKLEFDWKMVPCRDVIAVLPGTEAPDEWIMRGNHHDGWVLGAADPLSGQVAMLEEARAIADLVKQGWKPRRTIVYCSWDGEEEGLLGSTEFVETHAEELSKKAAVYINTDENGRGYLGVAGSHALESLVQSVAKEVKDPETGLTLAARGRASARVAGAAWAAGGENAPIGALGSGSDFSSFLQHIGVSSLNVGFGGEGGDGSYHSLYDSYDSFVRFGDVGFKYGVALAQTCGHLVMKLASDPVLPFNFNNTASTFDGYVKELVMLVDQERADTVKRNQLIKDGSLTAVIDPVHPTFVEAPKDAVPFVNLAPLQNAVAHLTAAAKAFAPEKAKDLAAINQTIIGSERALLGDGLPGRPWYRHEIYAPGLYTGYGVKTIPGVREAIEERNWKRVEEQVPLAAAAIERLAVLLESAGKQ